MRQLIGFFVCILITQGCALDDDSPGSNCVPVPVEDQDDIIEAYIDGNGWTVQSTSSGLRYTIDTPGAGDNIMYGDTIELEYLGVLLDGTVFDQGTLGDIKPLILQQGAFIPGFEEGLQFFNEGSEGVLILPSALGYGCFPPPGSVIDENEVLIFEINILSVKN